MIEHSTDIDPKIEQAIGHYRQVVGAFNELFGEISQRTSDEEWKADGIGSCVFNGADSGIEGVVGKALLVARTERNAANDLPRIEDRFTCKYHRANYGCALGDLKPLVCVSHVENKDEVRDRFGIDYLDFAFFAYGALRRVQFSRVDELAQIRPEENEAFVEETLEQIRAMVERVKSAPEVGYERLQVSQPEFG